MLVLKFSDIFCKLFELHSFPRKVGTHDLGHPDFPQASKTKFYLFLLGTGTVKGGTPSKELFLVDYRDILGKFVFFSQKRNVNIAYENVKLQIFIARTLLQIFNVVTI